MKKLVKQGAKLAHILIDLLAEEIAGKKLSKEKKKNNGKKENDISSRRRSSHSTDKNIHKKELNP